MLRLQPKGCKPVSPQSLSAACSHSIRATLSQQCCLHLVKAAALQVSESGGDEILMRNALSRQALGGDWLPTSPPQPGTVPVSWGFLRAGASSTAKPHQGRSFRSITPSFPTVRATRRFRMVNEKLSSPKSTTATISPISYALNLLGKSPEAQAKSHSESTGCSQYGPD